MPVTSWTCCSVFARDKKNARYSSNKPVVATEPGGRRMEEIFVDIIEKISVTFSSSGYILTSEIDGTIEMKSYLTGNPEIRLAALNEDLSIGRSQGPTYAMYVDNCPSKDLNFQGQGHCVLRFLGRFSFQPLRENPMFGPSSLTLTKMGALKLDGVAIHHEGWRLITCIWLHVGVVHLAGNMISIALIGIRLEQQFGFVRIGVIYLVSGFGGSVLSSLFFRNHIAVGASGALHGLFGAMLSELITNWSIYTNKAAALFALVFAIAIDLAIGLLPQVDNYAHIGGFLTGFLLGFIFLPRPQLGWLQQRHAPPAGVRNKSKYKAHQYVLWILSVVLLIVGLCIALVMLFRGDNGYDHCHWCHYLTCVPTSKWKCDDS